jgi:hypothetical protein
MTDVERWPEWTKSVERVQRLGSEPFGVGSQVRIKQPRFPEMVWAVTSFEPGHYFEWETQPGLVQAFAAHGIEPMDDGGTILRLILNQVGLAEPLLGLFIGGLTSRYMGMEAAGLKKRAEDEWQSAKKSAAPS